MKTVQEVLALIKSCGKNMVAFLEYLRVLYIRPKRGVEPNGPLVGRESTYAVEGQPGIRYRYVSENYYNGTELLQYPDAISHLAKVLVEQMKIKYVPNGVIFKGIGKVGEMLAQAIATIREQSETNEENTQEVNKNDSRIALVQDIFEPISLMENIHILKAEKKELAFICCVINPEQGIDEFLHITHHVPILIITLIKELLTKYQQNNPRVAQDIENGNIVWDPKENWDILDKVMAVASLDYISTVENNKIEINPERIKATV